MMVQKRYCLNKSLIFTLVLFYLSLNPVNGQMQSMSLFTDTSLLKINFIGEFRKIIKSTPDSVYSNASIQYYHHDSLISVPVKIRKRGVSRQNPEVCNFPPLLLKFSDIQPEGSIFKGFDKLKLVTHCQTGHSNYEQYLLLEYLAYRIYNHLTDYSFKVRLLQINYIFSDVKNKQVTHYGFLIEDLQNLASRCGCNVADMEKIRPETTQREMMTLMPVFQFMIGNTDWSVTNLHNIKIIKKPEISFFIPVPYDFDGSGFVNPPYAKPADFLDIETVRDRIYRGYPRSRPEMDSVFAFFNDKKLIIYSLIKNQQGLKNSYKKNTSRFLDDFYRIINNEKLKNTYFYSTFRE